MNEYVARDTRTRSQEPSHSPAATRPASYEAMPLAGGRFVREDERPRTESYGELYQRASVYMRRR